MAIGYLAGLVELGWRVPADMALAGFDGIPIARFVTPPLTTVHLAIADLGGRAITRVLRALGRGDGHARREELVPTTLVIRDSCGAGRSAAPGPGRGTAEEKAATTPKE